MPVSGGVRMRSEIASLPNRISNLKTLPVAKVTFGMATEPPASPAYFAFPLEALVAAVTKFACARAMISFTSYTPRPYQSVKSIVFREQVVNNNVGADFHHILR